MVATIELAGLDKFQIAMDDLSDDIRDQVDMAVVATGLDLERDIKQRIMRGPATGRVYQKYNPRRTHRASAPGEAPATDTGRLANSVTFKQDAQASVSVFSLLKYAPWLEFGTFRMGPRPAWVPAVEAMRPKYGKRLEAALSGVLR